MDFPPRDPRDLDFTEIEAILRVHEHPPFGMYAEVVMGRVLRRRIPRRVERRRDREVVGRELGGACPPRRVVQSMIPALRIALISSAYGLDSGARGA